MTSETSVQGVTATLARGCLVVSLPQDLAYGTLDSVRAAVLDGIQRHGCRSVVLEVSSVAVMDCAEFAELREIGAMARLLGAQPLLAGLSPWVIMYLVDNQADTSGIESVRDLEAAFDRAFDAGARR